jgi:hypothetical protein
LPAATGYRHADTRVLTARLNVTKVAGRT